MNALNQFILDGLKVYSTHGSYTTVMLNACLKECGNLDKAISKCKSRDYKFRRDIPPKEPIDQFYDGKFRQYIADYKDNEPVIAKLVQLYQDHPKEFSSPLKEHIASIVEAQALHASITKTKTKRGVL